MTRHRQVNSKINGTLWTGAMLATFVSTMTLIFASGPDRQAIGLATWPFGWNRVIVIHSLSSLMLSWWCARSLAKLDRSTVTMWPVVFWCLGGLAIAGLTLALGTAMQRVFDAVPLGYTFRLLIRVVWCVVLQLPWWMTAISLAKRCAVPPVPAFSEVNLFALALVAAIGVPLSFLAVFIDQQTNSAKVHWKQTQVSKAMRQVQRLCDLGSTLSFGERPALKPGGKPIAVTPQMALADLKTSAGFIGKRIDELAANEDFERDCVELANWYVALDRRSEAIGMLRPVADRRPSVAITLAQILNEQGQRDESRRWAKKALAMIQQNDADDSVDGSLDSIELRAYDLLVVLAGEEAEFKIAEQLLQQALERLPQHQAYLHGRLAKHYQFVGQLSKARTHQQIAADVDPENYLAPESLWEKMLSTGAPIGLARPKSSRYK